jgi:maltose/maltodextrin transport system permease protein/arabinogalactan oligomer/maltooligosaccharide transport system permease protein
MEGNVLDLNEIKHSYDDSEFPGNIDNFYALDHKEIFKNIKELQNLKVTYLNGWLRLGTLKEFYYYIPQYIYDSKKDILIDNKTEKIYRVKNAQFVSDDGELLDPGWTEVIGFQNYIRLLTTEKYRKPFFSVFLWTIEWSVLTVFFSFVIGLGLALLLNDPKIKMRKFYRSLLILPYAMPAFISLLIWRYGFYNSDFGLFNKILNSMFNITIPWLNSPGWARFSVILTNVWLTFPYMMLVSLGALQAVPGNLLEAARIDGANGFQRFRKITFPLIMISIAPLLIGSFATTFNNFTVIWLLTEGNPITGIGNVSGATDILISYAYKLAFVGKAGNELGLSSAVAVVIFLIVVTISVLSFRRTKVLEEVADEL